jgi:hypothetical protein
MNNTGEINVQNYRGIIYINSLSVFQFCDTLNGRTRNLFIFKDCINGNIAILKWQANMQTIEEIGRSLTAVTNTTLLIAYNDFKRSCLKSCKYQIVDISSPDC